MTIQNRLHLDHSDPGAKRLGLPGDRLVHAVCNEGDGGAIGAAITHANGNRPRVRGPLPPQPMKKKPPMTEEQIAAAMESLAPHHEGCRCREAMKAQGVAGSRCW